MSTSAVSTRQCVPRPAWEVTPGAELLRDETGVHRIALPTGKFLQVSPRATKLFEQLADTSAGPQLELPEDLTPEAAAEVLSSLHAAGALMKPGAVQPASRRHQPRFEKVRWTMIRFRIFSGEAIFPRLAGVWALATRPVSMVIALLLVGVGLVTAASTAIEGGVFAGIRADPAQLALVFGLMGATTAAHELGHGLELARRGGRPGGMGAMLLCFMPSAYCDVTDVWRLPTRRARIAVSAAGPAVSFVATGLASLVLLAGWTPLFLRAFVLVNTVTIAFNLAPFIRTDLYWMIAHWRREPSMLTDSRRHCRDMLRRLVRRPAPPFSWGHALYGLSTYLFAPVVVLWSLLGRPFG